MCIYIKIAFYKSGELDTKTRKFTYKEQKEYEQIDSVIEILEEEIAHLEQEMVKCATNFVRLQEITKEKEQKEEELMFQMERWEYLNELAERIANQ